MKKALLLTVLIATGICVKAQTFWLENWATDTCTQGCTTYTGINGPWTDSLIGTNGAGANTWYFSKQEDANGRGQCGTSGNKVSMHIGNVAASPAASLFCPTGDCGAAYDASTGSPSVVTNKMEISPIINCTGKSNITLSFNYMMGGEAGHDYGLVWYYDSTKWDTLAKPAITALCGAYGKWTYYSVMLPSSADNNPKIRVGFNWRNNANNSGNDPSFAVDSVQLSTTPTGVNDLSVNSGYTEVFPNPSNGKFTIKLSAVSGHPDSYRESVIEVYNVLGEKVFMSSFGGSAQSAEEEVVDIRNKANGIYFYRVLSESGDLVGEGKLIKE